MKILNHYFLFLFCLTGILWPANMVGSGSYSKNPDCSFDTKAEEFSSSSLACYTPTWPVTSNITQTSATFSWDVVYGAQSYSVQSRIPNGTWYNVPGSPVSGTAITVTWFLPNTTYEWRVRANCTNGEYSYWTSPIVFTTLGSSYCNAPDWLYTTNITQTSATFDWEPVSGAMLYELQYRVVGGSWYNVPGGPFYDTWYTITGLEPGTDYQWRVRAKCANWVYSSWAESAYFVTLGYSCEHPTWLSTTYITQTGARLNWDPVYGATNYSIQLRETNGSWYDLPGGPFTGSWVMITGLSPGTCYEWRIRSNCSNWNYSSWSYPEYFCTLGYSCSIPTWPSTSNLGQTSATFSWDPVSGATSYSVEIRLLNGNWYAVPGSPTYSTWISANGLNPCTTYQWRVKANCGGGNSSYWTNPSTFTTLCVNYCTAPTWLSTTNITQSSATLNWDPVNGALGYSIQYHAENGSWITVPGGPFNQTWYTLNGLQPGTSYEWRVKSHCANGTYSAWSSIAYFTTLGYSCSPPYWLSTSNITQNSAKLSWEPVAGASSYSVQMRLENGYWYDLPGGPYSGTWYTVYDLQPGTCYQWRVRSNCSNWTYSSWSYPQNFCTLGYSCSTPTWPVTSNITQTTATLSWDAVYGANSYTVQIRLSNGSWWDVQGSPTYSTWIYVTGLYPCTAYQWRVKANCGYGSYSYWTKPKSFTTQCTSNCQAPTGLVTLDITQYGAKLKWNSVTGASSYSVEYRVVGGTWQYLPGGPFNGNWVPISGLQPGTTYEWHVKTNCYDWSSSGWSHSAYFTTLGPDCSMPTWFYTNNITSTSATLNWAVVQGASTYSIELFGPNGQWVTIPGSPFGGNTATVTGLLPGTTYLWRLRTNCSNGGYSYWTQPVSFTTLTTSSCAAPNVLSTDQITETSARLDWSDVAGALSYDLQMRILGGDWVFVQGGPWTVSEFVVTGLLADTTYDWRVRSKCGAGLFSEWSAHITFTTLNLDCTTPANPSTTGITDTTVTLNWTAVPGAVNYSVEMQVGNGSWLPVNGSPFVTTSIVVDSLQPATVYSWRVRANCSNGESSGWTSPLAFTTSGAPISGSNECDGATTLTVNSNCVNSASSNVGATESSPGPLGWCPENEYNDVWFKFTMPDVPNPVVTVRTTAGSLTDAIMEVYRGGGCQDLEFITCEDDNNNGSGSTMPVISVTGTAGETIWVRVWGYAGTTGTFNICAFNYQSNDFASPNTTPDVFFDGEVLDQKELAIPTFNEVSTTLHVSPNPTRDLLNVAYTQTDQSKVTGIILMDMSGKVVFTKTYQQDDIREFNDQLDVSAYSSGIYLLRVNTMSGILTEKIMITD
jgi:fibronectin type III domain protein/type IX secretion system substrate protein